MILYHGTTVECVNHIKSKGLKKGSWLSNNVAHAFRIAYKRSIKRKSEPVVLKIESSKVIRIAGRDEPTYQVCGESKIVGIYKLSEVSDE